MDRKTLGEETAGVSFNSKKEELAFYMAKSHIDKLFYEHVPPDKHKSLERVISRNGNGLFDVDFKRNGFLVKDKYYGNLKNWYAGLLNTEFQYHFQKL